MLFRKRSRLRALDERECYLRLHGARLAEIEVIRGRPQAAATVSEYPAPTGPSDDGPALHLVFAFPRGAARMSGEQVRLELLRRMESRTREAA